MYIQLQIKEKKSKEKELIVTNKAEVNRCKYYIKTYCL